MSWAFVQSRSVVASSLVFNANVGAGNFLVAMTVTTSGSSVTTFSDNNGGTWVTDIDGQDAGDGNTLSIGHSANHGAGSTTITASPSPGAAAFIIIAEYSGIETSSPLDVSAWQVVSGSSYSSGNTAATAAANELVIGTSYDVGLGILSAGSGFTLREAPVVSFGLEDKDSGGVGVQSATWTTTVGSGNKIALCVVYKIPGGAAAKQANPPVLIKQAVHRGAFY